MPLSVETTADFDQEVKQLQKRYRRIGEDLRDLIADILESGYRGDRLPHTGAAVYKLRARNRSAQRGKSGGFRILYTPQGAEMMLFIHIYSKSDKAGVTAGEVRRILRDLNV